MRYNLALFILLFVCGCKSPRVIVDAQQTQKSKAFITAYHEGLRLKFKGNYLKAIERFEFCIKEEPLDDASHFAMAQTYLLLGDLVQAEKHTISAVDLDKDNVFYQIELAYMFRSKGAFNSAGKLFESVIDRRQRGVEYYLLAIDSYRKFENYTAALKVLEKLENFKGNVLECALRRHSIYVEMGKLKEAEKELLRLREEFPKTPMLLATLVDFYFQQDAQPKAIEHLKLLIDIDPQNGIGNLMLGEYAYQQGEEKIAAQYFFQAIQTENISAEESLNALEFLIYVNDLPKLKQSISVMERMYIESDTVISALGDYYFQRSVRSDVSTEKKDSFLVKAIDKYTRALELNPGRFDLWQKTLYYYYDSKQWQALKKTAEQTVRTFPLRPEPFYLGAVAYNQQEDYISAESFARQGLLSVIDDRILESDLLGQLGEAFFGRGNLEQGMVYYLQAIALEEKATVGYLSFNLSLRLFENKHALSQAVEILEKVLEGQNPRELTYELLKVDLFFLQKKYNETLNLLDVMKSNDTLFIAGILERKGNVFSMLKDKDKAIYFWKSALEIGGSSPLLLEKIKKGEYVE